MSSINVNGLAAAEVPPQVVTESQEGMSPQIVDDNIEDVLSPQIEDDDQEIKDLTIDDFIEQLECNAEYNEKFKMSRFCSRFQIKDLPPNPEELLHQLFTKCVEDAIRLDKEKNGVEPDRLGALISSELLDSCIWIPIREIEPDTVDNILNRFLLVMQSRKRQGRGTIYGQPFTVSIHTVNVAALPLHQQFPGNGPNRRRLNPVHHNPRKCALIPIKNRGNPYCLFYALELTRIHTTKERNNFYYYEKKQYEQQKRDVTDLMYGAGVPRHGLSDYDAAVYIPKVVNYWNEKYADKGFRFKVFLFGPLGHYEPEYKYGPNDFNTPLAIYYENHHFNGVRNAGTMFKENNKYCFSCLSLYQRNTDHTSKCKARCRNCARIGAGRPCRTEEFFKNCTDCGKIFKNRDCYQHHLASGECKRVKWCNKCKKLWSVVHHKRAGRTEHICGDHRCETCRQYHNPERGCFIKPLELNTPKPYRLVTFDFESTQHQPLNAKHPEKKSHQVNFITAHITCTECLAKDDHGQNTSDENGCEICGENKTITFSERPFQDTMVDKQILTKNPLKTFVHWILFRLNKDYTTVAFSHYGGKYDMVLTSSEIYKHGLIPEMIRRGNKLYQLHVPKIKNQNGEVIFRDSFNLCPVSLGSLVGAFALNIPEKQFFPHLSNHPKNYDRVIPLPPKSDYLYGGFTKKKQREFNQWYEAELSAGATFNLNEKLAEYCLSDVQILTEALIAFRKEFLKISGGMDILRESMTIASACMKHFRLNHLLDNHIAIVPEIGYDKCDHQSSLALKYFQWYSTQNNVHIQTAISEGGEHKVGRYKLDGYIEGEDRGIEINGCVWHAHKCRFTDPDFELPNGKTVEKVQHDNEARLQYLRTQLRGGVTVIWECEIKQILAKDPVMKKAFDEYEDEGPIKIREAFTGGRTGPFRLHYEVPPGYKIKYFDYCSLYPFTTATTLFRVGHPRCHVIKRAQQQVLWTSPEQIPVKGLLKVFLVPPRQLNVPVMPVKFDDRLLFPLCRSCALQFPSGHVTSEYSCPHHSDQERGWVSTCTHMELAASLESGYKVINYYRSWEWDQWDGDIFRNYVAEMMELKIHASGFPEGVDEEKFIRECMGKFGIKIERGKMNKNAAMRIIAKLMNNNLWGRFSLRNNLCKTIITDSPPFMQNHNNRFSRRKYLDNRAIEVVSLDELTHDVIMITYEFIDEFVEENASSNLILSLWVTSSARLRLLQALQKVAQNPDNKLLYCDTDSIIFAYPEDQECPLETGPHLGDLTDEFPSHDIKEFVSGGCKAYALRMVDKRTGEEKTTLRVRGITLTGDVCKKLHFETFKESIINYGRPTSNEEDADESTDYYIPTDYPNFIQPNVKTGTVTSRPIRKMYRPIVTKGVVCRGLIIKDFGSN